MEITEETTIWFPGIYRGREGDYAKTVGELEDDRVIDLVRERVKDDGEWAIANDRVGDNADVMRKMMAWAGDPKNIAQCLEHVYAEENAHIRTVDWVCRDLANAAKAIGGSSG